tara:strand:+ start:2168 stop:2887 length:720 start_codon:yes stop_codon:yes gene_type:complete
LDDSEINSEYYYKNHLLTTVKEDGKPYLLFGIPYNSDRGANIYSFTGKENIKTVRLNIQKKNFDIQEIRFNKYKKKSQSELDRIYKERKEIVDAKKTKYDSYPDYNFIIPVDGIVTGVYGTQRYYNGKKGNYHNGHDIAADTGAPIYAPSDGKVMLTGHYYYNGKFVMMNHGNNLISMFLHMDDILVSQGSLVEKGQVIGSVGNTGLSTGPHLHWSVLLNNHYVDPLALVNKVKVKLDN